jgi:hypothetical protein
MFQFLRRRKPATIDADASNNMADGSGIREPGTISPFERMAAS